jgi:hypothetical protein
VAQQKKSPRELFEYALIRDQRMRFPPSVARLTRSFRAAFFILDHKDTDRITADQLPSEITPARLSAVALAKADGSRLLTAAEFHQLADVPPEVEWFANISNRHTRRAYENAVKDFMRFAGIVKKGVRWRSKRA